MWTLFVNNFIKLAFPLSLFLWSIFQPKIAAYVFTGISAIFVVYLFFIDIASKPKPNPSIWSADEIMILKKYHLALRFSFGARDFSCFLNGIRWSSFIWVPWLLWNHIWIPAAFLIINFFITSSLSVRLDPFFFLSDAVRRGQYQFSSELSLLQELADKLKNQSNF